MDPIFEYDKEMTLEGEDFEVKVSYRTGGGGVEIDDFWILKGDRWLAVLEDDQYIELYNQLSMGDFQEMRDNATESLADMHADREAMRELGR